MRRLPALSALLFIAALQVHRLDDPDTWWHLASGRLIAESGAIPSTDPFSYTAAGSPWINRQWLFELLAYACWWLGGPAGVALGAGAAFVAAWAVLLALARRHLPPWAGASLVALSAVAAAERFTVRPEALTFCLLAVYLWMLDRDVTWPKAATLVGLQIIWANVHALSLLGLVPIGAALLAGGAARSGFLPRQWGGANASEARSVGPLALAAVGGLLAEVATPWGLEGALYPLVLLGYISGEQLLSYTIVEHRATTLASLTPYVASATVALAALAFLAALASWRRIRVASVVVAIAFAWSATLARRNVALFAIGVVPLVAHGLAPHTAWANARLARLGRLASVLPAVLVAIVLSVETARVVHGDWYRSASLTRTFGLGSSLLLYPQGAVDFLQRVAPASRLYNDDVQGGFILWNAHPARRVFIDGRLQVYPPEVYWDWQRVLNDPGTFPEVAAKWGINAVLLHHPSPGRMEIAVAISRLPGWRVAYLDAGGVVLLADGASTAQPEGMTGPAPAAATLGMAGALERLVRPLRRADEEAMTYYQRGRAIYYLFGRAGFPFAHADFVEALRHAPDNAGARRGLGATAQP